MSLTKKLASSALAGSLLLGANNAKAVPFYEDFSSGVANPSLYSFQADPDGTPLADEYFVTTEGGNGVAHMFQGPLGRGGGNRAAYLQPNHTFSTGDVLEWSYNKDGGLDYTSQFLLAGDQSLSEIISGTLGGQIFSDENGLYNVRAEFQPNNLLLTRTSPLGDIQANNFPLTQTDGNYSVMFGLKTFSGQAHIDFDNVRVTDYTAPPTSNGVPDSTNTAYALGMGLAGLAYASKRKF